MLWPVTQIPIHHDPVHWDNRGDGTVVGVKGDGEKKKDEDRAHTSLWSAYGTDRRNATTSGDAHQVRLPSSPFSSPLRGHAEKFQDPGQA